ncbi:hypothetical protein BWQ96_09191 [Gracilariopsis chorda]|uniref:Uncharacterized protein n=1 Tax=Gracilariopsis chorda TaxID=448386 RepID=A0A2V3IG89_9FLOR|nr:hypothetical protein BWQ96_09191 [Gracilariopsis chorda]|eukprot:PXF41087.1 hypothetical protein BWQ96_09191 [Gracilariopsis chorda]
MVRVEPKKTGVASDDKDDDKEAKDTNDVATLRHRSSAPKTCEVVDLTLDSDDETPPADSPDVSSQQGETQAHTANVANAVSGPPNVDPMIAVGSDVQVNQDLVFTLRSDDYNWGEETDVANGIRVSTENANKDN